MPSAFKEDLNWNYVRVGVSLTGGRPFQTFGLLNKKDQLPTLTLGTWIVWLPCDTVGKLINGEKMQ